MMQISKSQKHSSFENGGYFFFKTKCNNTVKLMESQSTETVQNIKKKMKN